MFRKSSVYWGSHPIAIWDGKLHFQQQDWVETDRGVSTSTGTIEGAYFSLPYGDDFIVEGYNPDAYHFAGLDHDDPSDLDIAQYREYGSMQGHWMSPDPYDGSYDASNPQSFNRYAYALNNPLSLNDPLGLSTECTTVSTGGQTISSGCNSLFGDIRSGLVAFGGFIGGLFGGPSFHGTLQSRPNAPIATFYVNAYGTSSQGAPSKQNLALCAAKYGSAHSVASLLGLGNNYAANLFGGNSVSGLVNLGNSIFGGGPAPDFAKMALGGAKFVFDAATFGAGLVSCAAN